MKIMRLIGAPDSLAAVVILTLDSDEYSAEYLMVGDAIPLERRTAAAALRQLADALEADAERVGD